MPGFRPGKPPGHPGKPARTKLTGGHWVTMRGHRVYVRDGKVISGGVPGVTHHSPTARPLHPPDVDHARLAGSVAAARHREEARTRTPADRHGGWHVEVSPPRSAADREHLARATAKGHSAISVEPRPDVLRLTDRESIRRDVRVAPEAAHPDAVHHVVGGDHVASIRHDPAPKRPDRHVTHDSEGYEAVHRSRAGAENRVDRLVRAAVRDASRPTRLTVPRADDFDPTGHAHIERHGRTAIRLIRE